MQEVVISTPLFSTSIKDKLPFRVCLFFLEQKFILSYHYSTRHPLYPRPKAWDAATVWAKFERLDFHKNFLNDSATRKDSFGSG